jgi:hypothetical protein
MKATIGKTHRLVASARFSAFGILVLLVTGGSAQALTMQECSAKYRAAKAASALNGKGWNEFRKAECGSDAAKSSTAAPPPATQAAPAGPSQPAPAESPAKPGRAATTTTTAVFPSATSPKYSS